MRAGISVASRYKARISVYSDKRVTRWDVRTLEFQFSDLQDGLSEKDLRADTDSDRVSLQLVSDDQPLDCDFEFVDQGAVGHGDYYYVRAKQLDGAMAWSSPVWVGGEEPR